MEKSRLIGCTEMKLKMDSNDRLKVQRGSTALKRTAAITQGPAYASNVGRLERGDAGKLIGGSCLM